MKKLYVVKESNKSGKELFKGENYRVAIINHKSYNLIGDVNIDKPEEVIICSSKTGNALQYAVVYNTIRTVTNDTTGSFIILK